MDIGVSGDGGAYIGAVGTGARLHLDYPVGVTQDLGVMVHGQPGVAVGSKVVHDSLESLDIGRVKPSP